MRGLPALYESYSKGYIAWAQDYLVIERTISREGPSCCMHSECGLKATPLVLYYAYFCAIVIANVEMCEVSTILGVT